MLFLEVSGLHYALLSIGTGRQEVPQRVGDDEGHHGNSLGSDWSVRCWLAACIASPPIEAGQWPDAAASRQEHHPHVKLGPRLPAGGGDIF